MLGCGLGQGFYIFHPLPAFEFERLIESTGTIDGGLPSALFPLGVMGGRRTPLTPLLATG